MATEPRLDILRDLERQMELWERYEKKPDHGHIFNNHVGRAAAIKEHQWITNSPIHLIPPPKSAPATCAKPRVDVTLAGLELIWVPAHLTPLERLLSWSDTDVDEHSERPQQCSNCWRWGTIGLCCHGCRCRKLQHCKLLGKWPLPQTWIHPLPRAHNFNGDREMPWWRNLIPSRTQINQSCSTG